MRPFPFLATALLLALVLSGCTGDEPAKTSTPTSPTTSRPSSPTSSAPSATPTSSAPSSPATNTSAGPPALTEVAQTFQLTSDLSTHGDWAIRPAALTVANNTLFKVTGRNEDLAGAGEDHNWFIENFNKGTATVGPGQSATVDVEIRKAGTYKYFCTLTGHRTNGMEGTLTVTA